MSVGTITKVDALFSLRPGAKWTLRGDELEWVDTVQNQPTEAEIQAEIVRLQVDYDAKDYQRKRQQAYPSFADQFDLLYHGGLDAWKAAIDAVKQEYPK